jgi:two-component system CheB/CheR fusion protein
VGERLIQDATMVLDRWSRRAVEEQPNAKRAHHAVLLDHLHDFLSGLGRSLIEASDPYTQQHQLPAVFHGEQRWQTGWSLSEVVRDYQILRLVILDYLEEALDRPLRCRETAAIGLALDEAITASVLAYVKERDEHLRRLAEQRAAEDKQIQDRLRDQADALQMADRRKNEFITMLAHELRNPLATIYTALEIQRLKEFSDPDLQRSREVIERQLRQITRLVDDLLDVSRLSLGKLKLQTEPVDLATVVSRAVEMARPYVESRKHELHIGLPPQAIWLEADTARLTQVLTNLLHNAAKYTNDGGQIWLSAERNEERLLIKVRDTGIGISPHLLPHVFDPFTQEEQALDRADGGLGLGLALVRSLVELHGGTVQAFSGGPGLGSEFVVSLPMLNETRPCRDSRHKPLMGNQSITRRVLVVDDNKDAAKSLALLLRIAGHEVEVTHDGPSALDIALAWMPEVVLLDIGLPGMDGFEVARCLRAEPALKETFVVAISGYGQDDDLQRSKVARFHAHLTKPIDHSALARLLSGTCDAL